MHRLNGLGLRISSQLILALMLALWPSMALAQNESGSDVVDLLAHGSGECFWAARVAPAASAKADEDQRLETIVHARFSAPEDLRFLARVNGAVVDMTHRGTQLVVLLRDGQWRTIWPGGSATGLALPANAHAIALAAEGDRLWALAVVRGEGDASTRIEATSATSASPISGENPVPLWARALRKRASTLPATTNPVTQPTEIFPTIESEDAPSSQPSQRLVLFRLEPGGAWQAYAELPDGAFAESPQRVSLNVGSVEQPSIAIAIDERQIHVHRLTRERQWKDLGRIALDEPVSEFDFVGGAARPTLWIAGAAGPGRLYVKEDRAWRPIELETTDPIAAGEQPAIGMSLDRIRLLYTYHGKVFEQRYEIDGARLDDPVELALSGPVDDTVYYRWINLAAMVALVLAMFGSVRRRREMSNEQMMRAADRLAPVGARLAAGAIDALPVVVGMFMVGRRDEWIEFSMPADATVAQLLPLWIGVAIYVIHTMLSEMIWGRSLGKKIFGLRVVLMDGARAGLVPILLRNLLRLAELPIAPVVFVMMLYSPLRQRAGDIAAATLVVSDEQPPDDIAPGDQD